MFLTALGMVKSLCNGIKFAGNKNIESNKRIAIILLKGDESCVISCSAGLSVDIRKALNAGKSKSDVLRVIAGLPVMQNDEGIAYITRPEGVGGEQESAVMFETDTKVASYESLAAL